MARLTFNNTGRKERIQLASSGLRTAHCIGVKLSRVALVMKQDVSLDPVMKSIFGAETEMPEAGHFSNLIEQLFRGHN